MNRGIRASTPPSPGTPDRETAGNAVVRASGVLLRVMLAVFAPGLIPVGLSGPTAHGDEPVQAPSTSGRDTPTPPTVKAGTGDAGSATEKPAKTPSRAPRLVKQRGGGAPLPLPPLKVRSLSEPDPLAPADAVRYDSDRPNAPKRWEELPSWRKAEFFGIRAEGQLFVFVVDRSGSMGEGTRMMRAKMELIRSVQSLRIPQKFQVIFFNEDPWPLSQSGPLDADTAAKTKLGQFLQVVGPLGTTEPVTAVHDALRLQPDAVFLLSDGDFSSEATHAILQAQSQSSPANVNANAKAGEVPNAGRPNPGQNRTSIPIHCIDLSRGFPGPNLQRIAQRTGGQYVRR